MTAATATQPENRTGVTESKLRKIVKVVSNAKRQDRHEKWRNRILWVDDRPGNNVYERQAFEVKGIEFTLALSTDGALELLKTNNFSAIISDMGRKEGAQEGYVLLEKLRYGRQNSFYDLCLLKFTRAQEKEVQLAPLTEQKNSLKLSWVR